MRKFLGFLGAKIILPHLVLSMCEYNLYLSVHEREIHRCTDIILLLNKP